MQVKNVSKFQEFSICRPAVTDPHKIRPCNYTVWLPYPVEIVPERFVLVSISRLEN